MSRDRIHADVASWWELVLLRNSLHVLTFITWSYLLLVVANGCVTLWPALVSFIWPGENGPFRADILVIYWPYVRNYLAYSIPLLFVALWLTEASRALTRLGPQSMWQKLPFVFYFLRRTIFLLSIAVFVYCLWEILVWQRMRTLAGFGLV